MDEVPVVRLSSDQLRGLDLDHRSGFLLSLVDGELTLDQIRDVSGMPRREVLTTLRALITLGAIAMRE